MPKEKNISELLHLIILQKKFLALQARMLLPLKIGKGLIMYEQPELGFLKNVNTNKILWSN